MNKFWEVKDFDKMLFTVYPDEDDDDTFYHYSGKMLMEALHNGNAYQKVIQHLSETEKKDITVDALKLLAAWSFDNEAEPDSRSRDILDYYLIDYYTE